MPVVIVINDPCTCKAWDIQSAHFKEVLNLDQERKGALFHILDVAVRTSLRHASRYTGTPTCVKGLHVDFLLVAHAKLQ